MTPYYLKVTTNTEAGSVTLPFDDNRYTAAVKLQTLVSDFLHNGWLITFQQDRPGYYTCYNAVSGEEVTLEMVEGARGTLEILRQMAADTRDILAQPVAYPFERRVTR